MTFTKFEEIECWQDARLFARSIWRVTEAGPFSRNFSLKDQVQRATVSIAANIAEGFGRATTVEFARFLAISQASTLEVQSHLYIALDLEYINRPQFDSLYEQAEKIFRKTGSLIRYLNANPGRKFQTPTATKTSSNAQRP